jgi:hypothetical protein
MTSGSVSQQDFLAAVRTMRDHQRAWFGGDKSRARLNDARAAERVVDRMLADLTAGPPAQADMFGGGR